MKGEVTTTVWEQYQRGVEYKNKIKLYSDVDEAYRFYQGDQWQGVDTKGLPRPVFNIIKPVINYRVSNILSADTKIVYKNDNVLTPDAAVLNDIAEKLTIYAGQLYERLKIDYMSDLILKDSAITGNGFAYFYYDTGKQEVACEVIDGTNIYPQNPNNPSIQEQESIIIAFRRSVDSVREEAKANGVKDVDFIASDTEYNELAGDKAKIEVDDSDMCIVLLKFWKDKKTGTVWFKKCVKEFEIIKDTDLGLRYYPIAMMTWEGQKNCFFGISDISNLIPNQRYVNSIAAMIMYATTYTAFPTMVYDENLIETPTNELGQAIGVNGAGQAIRNVIDFITPGNISPDAFNMFNTTMQLTKELMGANDSALGNIDPEQASGKSILAVAQQSAIPLESIKRRFYNFTEDIAIIWADLWRNYSVNGKTISLDNEDGTTENLEITAEAFDKLMLTVKIDVGATNRYSELAVMQTLDNLLMNGMIPFDWWVELQPSSSGLPKAKLKELLNQQKQEAMAQQQAMMTQQGMGADFDIDAFLASLPEETRQQAIENPQILEELLAEQMQGQPMM